MFYSGLYSSNSEIIREALRGVMERKRWLEQLNSAIARGVTDAAAGGRVQKIDEMWVDLH